MATRKRRSPNNYKGLSPFVIVAGTYCPDCGCVVLSPVGVELAMDVWRAATQAARRWPDRRLYPPQPWPEVPGEIRLSALQADRMLS